MLTERSYSLNHVSRSFGRAAARYDGLADLQHRVALDLIDRLPDRNEHALTVDLGAGTCFHRDRLLKKLNSRQHISIDLSHDMNCYARQRWEHGYWLTADAGNLPLISGVADLIYSSMAMQWVNPVQRLIDELSRVSRSGSQCWLSVVLPGSLCELAEAWSEIDGNRHVHDFASETEWLNNFASAGWRTLLAENVVMKPGFTSFSGLLQSVQGVGAGSRNHVASAGLGGRARLKQLEQIYQARFVEDSQFICTYRIAFLGMEKQ